MSAERWRPGAGPEIASARAAMLGRARDFFAARGVLEVDTPILSRYAVTDPNIESLSAHSALGPTLYLRTSPEYRMKRLLAAGFGDIYEIGKVFRDGEAGRNHLREFTLVEWYRRNVELRAIMQETVEFIACLVERPGLADTAEFHTYAGAFASLLDVDPETAAIEQLCLHAGADDALRQTLGAERDAWLDLLLATQVAPRFAADRLTVIYHYPARQAALARLCPDDSRVADRFEVFLGGLELANGFVELLDADEQSARFGRDRQIRGRNGQPVHDPDPDFIAALDAGLPPCSGVAVGFDRLLGLQQNAGNLAAVTHFVC